MNHSTRLDITSSPGLGKHTLDGRTIHRLQNSAQCSSCLRLATYPHIFFRILLTRNSSSVVHGMIWYDIVCPDSRRPLRIMWKQLLMTYVIINFLAHYITARVPAQSFGFSFLRNSLDNAPRFLPPPFPLSVFSLSSFLSPSST